jgi:hypothetical protein
MIDHNQAYGIHFGLQESVCFPFCFTSFYVFASFLYFSSDGEAMMEKTFEVSNLGGGLQDIRRILGICIFFILFFTFFTFLASCILVKGTVSRKSW